MALFTIRVELNAARSEDYATLARHLALAGITDFIRDDSGVTYRLPPAEYSFVGNATLEQVVDATNRAASATGRTYAVVANEASRRMWVGLPRA